MSARPQGLGHSEQASKPMLDFQYHAVEKYNLDLKQDIS